MTLIVVIGLTNKYKCMLVIVHSPHERRFCVDLRVESCCWRPAKVKRG